MSPALNYIYISLLLIVSIVLSVSVDFLVDVLGFANNEALGGWFLFVFFILSLLFYVRKRLSTLALGSAHVWNVVHHMLAISAFCYFVVFHTDTDLPKGWFNSVLYLSFLLLILSGVVLTLLNRLTPPFFREKYAQDRASLGALMSRRGQLVRDLDEWSVGLLELIPSTRLLDSLLDLQLMFEQRSPSFIRARTNKTEFSELLQSIESELDDPIEFNHLMGQLLMVNSQIAEQRWLKSLLSFHLVSAFLCFFLILFHIALVVMF